MTLNTQSGSKERRVLALSSRFSFSQSKTPVGGTMPPTLTVDLLPQLAQSRSSLTGVPRALSPPSRFHQVDNQYQHIASSHKPGCFQQEEWIFSQPRKVVASLPPTSGRCQQSLAVSGLQLHLSHLHVCLHIPSSLGLDLHPKAPLLATFGSRCP